MKANQNASDRGKYTPIISSVLSSRNPSSNQTSKKKSDTMKYTITSKKNSSKFHFTNIYCDTDIIAKNLIKHNSTIESYHRQIISSIIFDEKKKIVSIFKNYLLWDETSEFLKRFYFKKEANNRIPKISGYYEDYTLFSPIYFSHSISIVKLMNRFTKRKKRYYEYLEDNEDNKPSIINKKKVEKFSAIIKPSLIRTQTLLSAAIDKQQNDHTITLSKISVNNSKLSFHELIEKTLSNDSFQEVLKIKPIIKKFYLKKGCGIITTTEKIGVQIPKIKLTGINTFFTESNPNRNKRNIKQTHLIIDDTNSKTTFNNSISKQFHQTIIRGYPNNKFKGILNKELHSKSNKINYNIIQRKPINGNLVLTVPKKDLRQRILICDKDKGKDKEDFCIPKITQNSGFTKVKTKNVLCDFITDNSRTNKHNQDVNKQLLQVTNEGFGNRKKKHEIQQKNIITINKVKELNQLEIPKLPMKNYPLTTRQTEENKKPLSVDLITKIIITRNKYTMKSNFNPSKKTKGLINM